MDNVPRWQCISRKQANTLSPWLKKDWRKEIKHSQIKIKCKCSTGCKNPTSREGEFGGYDCTFAESPLQQVVFSLQFGDEITALQKLPEFLWRIGSNYMAALGASLGACLCDSNLWSGSFRQRTNWESLFKSLYQTMSIFKLKQDSSWSDMRTIWRATPPVIWSKISKGLSTWESPVELQCAD